MKPRGVTAAALVLAALATTGCSGGDHASAAPDAGAAAPQLDFRAFEASLTAYLDQAKLAGASVVVVHKDYGIVLEKGYGAFSADRLFLIASSSKVMSVGVLMRLADEGKLDLDAPISQYLSAWGSYKTNLSVAQLVSNSSGLVSLIDNPVYLPYICQYENGGTLSSCAKAIYTAMDDADRRPPDTKFDYGGGAWQLAGGIAEVVGGKPWAELVKETYVDPCGTPSVGYNNPYQRIVGGANLGAVMGDGGLGAALTYPSFFQSDAGSLVPTQNPSIEGGAYVTAHDYGKLLLMHLRGGVCDGGRVLSEAAVARMQKDRIGMVYGGSSTSSDFAGYGLGWWVDRMHPGVVADPGAFGAVPWIEGPRGYAAMILLEGTGDDGPTMLQHVKPSLDAVFDALGDAGR